MPIPYEKQDFDAVNNTEFSEKLYPDSHYEIHTTLHSPTQSKQKACNFPVF
jgi:hypothetical protein